MHGGIESLNAAVAAAVLLYEAQRQRTLVRQPARTKRPMSLFDEPPAPVDPKTVPLAERMRPRTLDEIVGQDDLVAPGRPLREMIDRDLLQSIILWGPPGTGKTTLARLIADLTKAEFVAFSAVLSGIKEVKEVMAAAEQRRRMTGRRTIVFVDEIHRFNKAQQDAFLPRVESGDIVLIGATTENPSFEVNAALLSRSKVFVLKPLDEDAIVTHPADGARPMSSAGSARENPEADDDALRAIARFANGDARAALNLLQLTVSSAQQPAGPAAHRSARCSRRRCSNETLLYDKSGEEHYNLMSALHKSMRNSDADASIYWLARMLEAGEDPKYVARRLIRFASEDIGNADPQALAITVAAKDAVHFIGMPEGNTALAQAVLYLATAPKSNAVYMAYGDAAEAAKNDVAVAGAAAHPERADQADEAARLRQGLPVRARRAGRRGEHGLPAGQPERPRVLQADGLRV